MNPDSSNIVSLYLENTILRLQYETQHLGFHPRTFLDIVYNIFFENVTSSLTQMKQYLIQEFKKRPEVFPPNLIKAQTDIFLQDIVKQLDKSIDKLEVYLVNNVFSIDKHVLLPEDEVHIKNPCTKEDDEKLDLEIKELKQKILAEKAKQIFLKKKLKEQEEVKAQLESLKEELESLVNIARRNGVTPETIESLYSDLTQLNDYTLFPI